MTHGLNKRCEFTHVEGVKGCIKDFGIYTSPIGYDFVVPKEVRINLSKHPITVPKELDVEKWYHVPDPIFIKKCIEDAAKLKTTINLNKENPNYSMTALELCMFANRYGSIIPLNLIPNLLYVQTYNEDRVEQDKSKLYSDWYEFKVNMKCPVEGCMLKDFRMDTIGNMR